MKRLRKKTWFDYMTFILLAAVVFVGCSGDSESEEAVIETEEHKAENEEAVIETEEHEAENEEAVIETEEHKAENEEAVIEKEDKAENTAIEENVKPGWTLTFSDDFDGTELDPQKWRRAPEWKRHNGHWSNQEAFLNGKGQLIIQISEKDGQYYSGAIRTKDLFEQAHGYFEIRAKIPKEEGFWTAFWLMSDSVHEVGNEGKDGTEVDILETPFAKDGDKIQHALHWDGYGDEHQSTFHIVDVPGLYEGYHTFALEWNEEEYIFYVDEEETWRTSAGGVSEVPAYVKITAEVGRWAGHIQNANLPAQLEVDYVRVYKQN